MRKLRIGIIDLVTKAPTKSMWARVMHANFASIMPQALGAWCRQDGHDVTLICYTGFENLSEELPRDMDIVFISAFTHAAQLTYALSNLLRSRGAVTVLGGPHARCYPQDAVKYFDYVVGFTDQDVVREILDECSPQRPLGRHLSAKQQPRELPGVKERWEFMEPTLDKAPLFKIVPMIGSLGCPYTCNFCIDSTVPYQQLSFDVIKDDLRFLRTQYKRPRIAWQDPNFGVRFNEYLDAIEDAVPVGSIDFFAETSLALLSEERLKRLRKNGFQAILPGIESWFGMGNKSKVGKGNGIEKVKSVAEQINTILSHVPYLQANFVLGLDCDEGPDPFELTKRFVDLSPGAYPAYSLLTAFGQAAPLNLEYQRAGRVIPFPFHFLNTQHAMNVKPKNYAWPEFYNYLMELTDYTFSWRAIRNRLKANGGSKWKYINVLRGMTSQGRGRIKFYRAVRDRLNTDRKFRDFFEGETGEIPQSYIDAIRTDLGPLWDWLPEGALYHDPNAYLKSQEEEAPKVAVAGRR
ncbi:MAG: B12-binding domain-containing radical SAM protein [Gemmatimonadales bacterium]